MQRLNVAVPLLVRMQSGAVKCVHCNVDAPPRPEAPTIEATLTWMQWISEHSLHHETGAVQPAGRIM